MTHPSQDVEVFILQTEGRKRWKLYPPLNGYALPATPSGDLDEEMLQPCMHDIVLSPGDLLYLPRGVVHQVGLFCCHVKGVLALSGGVAISGGLALCGRVALSGGRQSCDLHRHVARHVTLLPVAGHQSGRQRLNSPHAVYLPAADLVGSPRIHAPEAPGTGHPCLTRLTARSARRLPVTHWQVSYP